MTIDTSIHKCNTHSIIDALDLRRKTRGRNGNQLSASTTTPGDARRSFTSIVDAKMTTVIGGKEIWVVNTI